MKKIKEYMGIIIIVLVLILGTFYWFQVKPNQTRKKCVKNFPLAFGITSVDYQPGSFLKAQTDKAGYEKCLREHGLEK